MSTELRDFFSQLETMIGSGLQVGRALYVLSQNQSTAALRSKISRMVAIVDQGRKFSEAMSEVGTPFTRLHVSFIRFGEESGCLEKICSALARHAEREVSLTGKLGLSILYPAFVLCFALLMGPAYQAILSGSGVLGYFRNLGQNFLFLALGGAILFYSYRVFLQGSMDTLVVNLPVIGALIRSLAWSRFARAMAISQFAGVPLLQGIETSVDLCGNAWIQKQLSGLSHTVEKGQSLSDGLRQIPAAPVGLIEIVAVGEESGRLPEVFEKIATQYEDEVAIRLDMLVKLLPVFIFLAVGLYVGYMVLSFGLNLFSFRID
jgi:type IV pilus assembly protein PilC